LTRTTAVLNSAISGNMTKFLLQVDLYCQIQDLAKPAAFLLDDKLE